MFKKILYFFVRLFQREEYVSNMPSYSDVVNTPVQKMRKIALVTEEQNKKLKPKAEIDVDKLTLKIKNNIFYLEELMFQLEDMIIYKKYHQKITDLKQQSEGSLKILYRMKKEAPYYQATVRTIAQHTNTIAQLMSIQY